MKRISILAIITLLFMAIEFITAFLDVWGQTSVQSVVNQRTEIAEQHVGKGRWEARIPHALNMVVEDEALELDSLQNTRFNAQIPYGVKQVMVCGWVPGWLLIISFLFLPLILLVIWGIVNFVKLLIAVFRHEIFTRKNARRLRIFVYTTNGSIALVSLYDWLGYHFVASQTVLQGYTVGDYEFAMSWSDMFLMCLFVEIFALGVKLQEEQELTI